jgi:hypothetical protein
MVFEVKVDDYATIMLRGSSFLASKYSYPVYTWVTSSTSHLKAPNRTDEAVPLDCSSESDVLRRENFVSCPQVYTAGGHTAVLMSLVVNLHKGKMFGLSWDNACKSCGPNRCMIPSTSFDLNTSMEGPYKFTDGICGQETAKCEASSSEESLCDMVVLVTFAGTDNDGRNLLTAGMRLSKFSGHTMKTMYETMDDNYNDIR